MAPLVSVTHLPPLAGKRCLREMEPLCPVFLNKEGNPSGFSGLCILGGDCWGRWGGGGGTVPTPGSSWG